MTYNPYNHPPLNIQSLNLSDVDLLDEDELDHLEHKLQQDHAIRDEDDWYSILNLDSNVIILFKL